MHAWPLTGRAEEVDVIADALCDDDSYAGVVIAGSAGVGKTRLAREAMALAVKRGWAVRWVAGTVAAQSIPLGACAQWADRLEGDPLQLVGSVIAKVTASPNGAPVLVVVDDARLLDNLSAFVLQQLVLRRAATVIATIRTGAPAPDTVTALWKDGHLRRLDLQPLSRGQSDALLQSALAGPVNSVSAERIWRLTRGNVLFLHQLVTQEMHAERLVSRDRNWQWVGTMQVSPSLVDLVDLRIGETPEPVLEIIDLVAVAEPLELAYLTALADASAIEDAERRGLITVSMPTSVARLGHPLYGEVRLAQAGQLRLERLRGSIARTITATDGVVGTPDPVRLALLWLQSDLAPDHEVFTQGAQAAFRRLDVDLAQRLAAAAMAAGAGVDAELLCGSTLMSLSRGAEGEELLKSMTARALPEPAWSMAVHLRADNLLWPLGQPEQSRKVIDDALVSASEPVSHRLLAFRALQLAVEARPADALDVCESIDRTALFALPALKLACAHAIAFGDLGQPLRAAASGEEAVRLAAGAPEAAFFQSLILVLYYTQALALGGYLAEALAVANRADQQCADVPGTAQAFAADISGIAALGNGDLGIATERLRGAVAGFANRTDGGFYHFGFYYVEALARKGDLGAASEHLAKVQRSRHPAHAYRESDSLLAAAWVAAARGRTSQAQALAREAAEFACTHGQNGREAVCLQAAIQFGDQHTATRLAELAELVEGPRAGLVARWAAALSDHEGGEALLAVSHDLEAMGDRIAAADAAAHASLLFHQQNRRGPALTASGCAERLITDCGAITPATQAARIPLPLSDREREIATLIAQGLSNNEIAEALTLSVRTVEGHIYRACARVGAASRTELAQLITQFAPPHPRPQHHWATERRPSTPRRVGAPTPQWPAKAVNPEQKNPTLYRGGLSNGNSPSR